MIDEIYGKSKGSIPTREIALLVLAVVVLLGLMAATKGSIMDGVNNAIQQSIG